MGLSTRKLVWSLLAGGVVAAGCAGRTGEPAPATPTPACPPAALRAGRQVSIEQLDGITRASGITTAALGRRRRGGDLQLPEGVQISTRCGRNWCVDGLSAAGRVLIPAALAADEAGPLRDDGSWRERVIRLAWADDRHISTYVASSELSGGAHANNALACRTFDRTTGRELRLGDVLPASSAKLVRRKVQPLLSDPNLAIDVLGEDLDAAGFTLIERGFRFGRTEGSRAAAPDVILCAEGPYPGQSSAIFEILIDRIPASYLLR